MILVNRSFRGVFALSLLLAPIVASAQIDVEGVSFIRSVDRIDNGAVDESAFAQVVVVGDDITSVDLTFPDMDTATLSMITSREFRLELDLEDEAELDTEFPGGTYELDINDGELEFSVFHEIPAVPSPAISSPVHESNNNSPTTTDFSFSGCPGGVCDQSTDHALVAIDEGMDPATSEFLPAGSDSYSPPELSENADFSFFVDNVSYRVSFELADVGDPFTLVQSFTQSDSVDFSTGFKGIDEAPQGDFSVVVPGPANGILDPSGNVNVTLAGVELDYDFVVAPNGKVTGTGNADVDGNMVLETPVEPKGKLKGKDGLLTLKVTTKIKNKEPGTEASAKYTREQMITAATGDFTGSELFKGKVLGVKVEEGGPIAGNIAAPVSWQLDFTSSTVDGKKLIVDGTFSHGAGAVFDLTGSGSYNSSSGTASINLKSGGDDKGASFKLKGLTVDAMGNITGGELDFKAYGQSGSIPLP